MMKGKLVLILIFASFLNGAFAQQGILKKYLKSEDYRQLGRYLREEKTHLDDFQREYLTAIELYAYNKPFNSNKKIDRLLSDFNSVLTDSLCMRLLTMQAINSVKLFEYEKARSCTEQVLNKYSHIMNAEKIADLQNSKIIWTALKNMPAQVSSIKRGGSIQMDRDFAGLLNVNVNFGNGKDEDFIFDTGANFSVVRESIAIKNKWKIIRAGFEVGSATGKKVKSDIAIADSIVLAGSTFRNVVFLLFADNDLTIKPLPLVKYNIMGIIGLPVIKEFLEIEIHSNGQLTIPEHISKKDIRNFALPEFMPLIYVQANNDTLAFHFDTGARKTFLFSTYLDKYPFIGGKQTTKTMGGAGGTQQVAIVELDELRLSVAGKSAALKDVSIKQQANNSRETGTYGNLGQDFLKQFKFVRINFASMFIEMGDN